MRHSLPVPTAVPNLSEERLQALKNLIPEAFSEGQVDFDKLRLALGDLADERPERYTFSWAGKRDAIPDPAVDKLIEDFRKKQGIVPRKISNEEIVERCIFALVNEAARLLEEGIAQRASDVDMVYLTGYGFPLHRGGPMLYADQAGLYNVVRAVQGFAAASGDPFWQPAPLLAKLAAEGKTFN